MRLIFFFMNKFSFSSDHRKKKEESKNFPINLMFSRLCLFIFSSHFFVFPMIDLPWFPLILHLRTLWVYEIFFFFASLCFNISLSSVHNFKSACMFHILMLYMHTNTLNLTCSDAHILDTKKLLLMAHPSSRCLKYCIFPGIFTKFCLSFIFSPSELMLCWVSLAWMPPATLSVPSLVGQGRWKSHVLR